MCFKDVLWKSYGCYKEMAGSPRDLQGGFKGASRVSKGSSRVFKRVLRQIKKHIKEVSRVFKEMGKCVSRKFTKKIRVFQKLFTEVLFCDFVVAWISSQLPEQMEGLFKKRQKFKHFLIVRGGGGNSYWEFSQSFSVLLVMPSPTQFD